MIIEAGECEVWKAGWQPADSQTVAKVAALKHIIHLSGPALLLFSSGWGFN